VAYLLIFGELPDRNEHYERFRSDVTYHTETQVQDTEDDGVAPRKRPPDALFQAVTSAMGMYYPARDTSMRM
jgi:citrate synthase